jgi:hypothetical protein
MLSHRPFFRNFLLRPAKNPARKLFSAVSATGQFGGAPDRRFPFSIFEKWLPLLL